MFVVFVVCLPEFYVNYALSYWYAFIIVVVVVVVVIIYNSKILHCLNLKLF